MGEAWLLTRLRRGLPRAVVFVALTATTVSLLVRFTVRDLVPGVALVYYATPLVLDALACAVAAVVAWRASMRRAGAVAAALALACGGLHAATSVFIRGQQPEGAIRGVFWNVAYGRAGWPAIAETLRGFDADVVWLAEIAADDKDGERVLAEALPGRRTARAVGGIYVLARGDVKLVESGLVGDLDHEAVFRHVVDGRTFECLQIDLESDPLRRRVPAIERALGLAARRLDGPLLVLGDFNTPRDSAGFDDWRPRLANAFEEVGRGLDATWPVPLPVLSCDQVWFGGGLSMRTCGTRWTWRSDHLPVVFTFDVR